VSFVASRIRSFLVRNGGLWAHADFMRLWGAQSISIFGTHITIIALPLLAVTTLDATPFEMGVLTAAASLPYLLMGLIVGVWVDQLRKRPLLIAADVGRALCLLSIPFAAVIDQLSISLLVVAAFVHGTLAMLFDVADTTYLPSLVRRDQLVEANGKLEFSTSLAQITGPALAGGLVALLTAPFALLIDSVSYLGSAVMLKRIEHQEEKPPSRSHESMRVQIGEGIHTILGSTVLRAVIATSTIASFAGEAFMAVYVFFLAEDLGLGAGRIGFIFAMGGVGALLGAWASGPLSRRIGAGHTMIVGQALFGITGMIIPAALLIPDHAFALIVACEFLQWGFFVMYQVIGASVRQAYTPLPALGRVQASSLLAIRGSMPIGALLGGTIATLIGSAWTLVISEIGMLLAVIPLLIAPIRGIRTLAEPDADSLELSATMPPIEPDLAPRV
jgi:MFS family permease